MGYRKPLDYGTIRHQIMVAAFDLRNSRVDGFTQWYIKQDLIRLKHMLDSILADAPKFPDEDEFIKSLECERMVEVLKK